MSALRRSRNELVLSDESQPLLVQPSKFSFISLEGLTVSSELADEVHLDPVLRVHRQLPYPIDSYWSERLGTLITQRVQKATLYLVSEIPTGRPAILDQEHERVSKRVHDLYWCLHLVDFVRLEHAPVRVAGSVLEQGASELRSVGELEQPIVIQGSPFTEFGEHEIDVALALCRNLDALQHDGIFPRLRAIMEAFHTGLHSNNVDFRLHQFVRCVEGFIAAEAGATTRRFKSRTELFVGPREHEVMDRLYDVRSSVEHLNDPFGHYSGSRFDQYLALWEDTVLAEDLARSIIRRFVMQRDVWSHFQTDEALSRFWTELKAGERRKLWGDPFDIAAIRRRFQGTYLDPKDLGLKDSDR